MGWRRWYGKNIIYLKTLFVIFFAGLSGIRSHGMRVDMRFATDAASTATTARIITKLDY